MFSNVHIVLINTSHSGNIGSSARAMKTMGFKNLILVNPKKFPSEEANSLAVGCSDVLENAKVYDSLLEALETSEINIGFTSRKRRANIPSLDINECVDLILSNKRKYNILFGNEKSGLSNKELLLCDYIVSLPTYNDYKSLNLSAAVQIFVYELFKKSFKLPKVEDSLIPLATSKEKNFFFLQLFKLLKDTRFLSEKNHISLTKKIHILFNKAKLDHDEINILLGMISSVNKRFNK